jgi:MoxR-like ATPase
MAEPLEPIIVEDDLVLLNRLRQSCQSLLAECGKVIVGQNDILEQLLIAVLARGHGLLVGVPGLAKTLMIRTLADAMNLQFNRIQFTPDLMPSDITGTDILTEDKTTGQRSFRFLKGPIFANVILADEINRTPPKTQAALLEAMQERQVTISGQRHDLPNPFFVLATQNPIEQEGTYPLPEAQQDRFLLSIRVGYPSEADEAKIIEQTTSKAPAAVEQVIDRDGILALQRLVRDIPAANYLIQYAAKLVRTTRPGEGDGLEFVKKYVKWGAGPRAGQSLVMAGKARALLHGRTYLAGEDLRAVAAPVLRHRIVLNYSAEADGISPDDIVKRLLAAVPDRGE